MQIVAKHSAWLLISLATGGTLIFYFTDAPELLRSFARGDVVGQYALLDRRLCRHHLRSGRIRARTGLHLHVSVAAPSGRDLGSGSLHGQLPRLPRRAADVGQEGRRTPPRGASRRETASTAISASRSVRSASTSVKGRISACINCGLCVDACDGVMSKLGRPRGLIDYESWNNIERGRRAEPPVSRLARPKTVGLTAACLVLTAAIVFSFMARTDATLSVQHDRDPLAVRLSDGSVRNAYTVKLLNKSSAAHAYTLSVSGVEARMAIIGNESLAPINVPADGSETVRVTLTAMSPREAELVFTARDESGTTILSAKDRFLER